MGRCERAAKRVRRNPAVAGLLAAVAATLLVGGGRGDGAGGLGTRRERPCGSERRRGPRQRGAERSAIDPCRVDGVRQSVAVAQATWNQSRRLRSGIISRRHAAIIVTGSMIISLRNFYPINEFSGGPRFLPHAAFTADSKSLVIADSEGVVDVWDVATVQVVRTLSLPKDKGSVLALMGPWQGRLRGRGWKAACSGHGRRP